MCGIFAIFAPPGKRLPDDVAIRLSRATSAIKHRGPDAQGVHVASSLLWAVGHVRLSVIDLAADSNQPFWSACGRYCIVFNGEIYNYLELRSELEREGVRFRTLSDTEVLLQAMVHWGPSCLPRLNGMWSFVFCDQQAGQFTISRDRWGVKPLYTMVHEGLFIVCSEAKGLFAFTGRVPLPDSSTVGLYLKYSVGGECESTWFRGVRRFPKRTYWQFDLRTVEPEVPNHRTYWDYPVDRSIVSAEEATGRLSELLEDAVRVRLRSDMPVGLSLSGGLDSATIAWIAGVKLGRPLSAYTAWHEPLDRSELPMARRVAASLGHRSISVAEAAESDLLAEVAHCVYHLDSGHTSPAIVPYLRLCQRARQNLTVMLEGQGADELLAGYTFFQVFAGADRLLQGQAFNAVRCFASYVQTDGCLLAMRDVCRFISRRAYESQALSWRAGQVLPPDILDAVPTRMHSLTLSTHNLDSALRTSHENGLTNLLQYCDAISMSVNLETRCPFLDYRVVELGFSIRENLLLRQGFGKHVLRTVMNRRLPDELVWDRRKRGFTNSTATKLRSVIAQRGLPAEGRQAAVQLGLIQPTLTSEFVVKRLPDSVLFRLVNVLLWAGLYYTGRWEKPPTMTCEA